jgi:hypothetical protein
MNITRASLFPGLDGFAQSFRNLLDASPPSFSGSDRPSKDCPGRPQVPGATKHRVSEGNGFPRPRLSHQTKPVQVCPCDDGWRCAQHFDQPGRTTTARGRGCHVRAASRRRTRLRTRVKLCEESIDVRATQAARSAAGGSASTCGGSASAFVRSGTGSIRWCSRAAQARTGWPKCLRGS